MTPARETLEHWLAAGHSITRLPPVSTEPEAAIARVRGLRDLAAKIPALPRNAPRLSPEQRVEVLRAAATGETYASIGARVGLHASTVAKMAVAAGIVRSKVRA